MKLFDLYGEIDIRTGKLNNRLGGIRNRLGGIVKGLKSFAKTGAIAFAAISAAATLAARSFIKAASSMEDYEVRLRTLLGSQEKAADAMKFFTDIASEVPFSIDAITEAGVTLEAMGAKHQKWLPVLSDLASVMGGDVRDAATALGRAYAGGAGAADIFREKGILNIIKSSEGIKDLSKLTLPEFRRAMFNAFVKPTGRIAGAAAKMADTWTGQMSMLGDSIFKLRDELGGSLLPVMKDLVTLTIKPLVNEWVAWAKENKAMLASNINSFMKGLVSTINVLAKGVRFLISNYNSFKDTFILASLDMRDKWTWFATGVKVTWERTTGFIAKLFLGLKAGWDIAIGALELGFKSFVSNVKIGWLSLKKIFSTVMGNIMSNVSSLIKRLEKIPKVGKHFTGLRKAIDGLGEGFSDSTKEINKDIDKIKADLVGAKEEFTKTKEAALQGMKDQDKATAKQIKVIEKRGTTEQELFKSIRKEYLKSMEKRTKATLTANKKIKENNDKTQEDITEKDEDERKKRKQGLFSIVDLWAKTQEKILEGQKGFTRGITGAMNAQGEGKKSEKSLSNIAAQEKKGNELLGNISENIEIIKNQRNTTELAQMGT